MGGPKEFIPDGYALFASPDSQDEWNEMITKLVNSPKLRKELGEKSKTFAEKYKWGKIIKKIIKVYES